MNACKGTCVTSYCKAQRQTQRFFYWVLVITLLFMTTTVVILGYLGDGQKSRLDEDMEKTNQKPAVRHLHAQVRSRREYENTGPPRHLFLRLQQELIAHQKRPPDRAYNYNVTLSDQIPLEREINDTRPAVCQSKHYRTHLLPSVTVIIPFFNEALSMLLRTVHSVLNRSPDHLLSQVILVDDCSTHGYLKEYLDHYVSHLPKVTILRNKKHEGLIRSRLFGAAQAKGQVLIFLDAHTECNVGWLEPILTEIQQRPNTVVQPFVDGIDVETLEYAKPETIHKGAFTWDLRYVWLRVPEYLERSIQREARSFWSPVLTGCAIAIDKSYFYSIGAFDAGLQIWGGENIELGFRAWMCNGTVITLPCSRVGHMFRPLPYKAEMHGAWEISWQKNLMRVADTWMDDMKKYFYGSTRVYSHKRISFSQADKISLQSRKNLRQRLGCKSFDWFLSNVVPEIPIPPPNSLLHGEIMNYKSRACWRVLDDGFVSITYECYEHKIIPKNIFTLTTKGLLMYRDKCVRFLWPKPYLKVTDCPQTELEHKQLGIWGVEMHDERWLRITIKIKPLHNKMETVCAMQVTNTVSGIHEGAQMVQAAYCSDNLLFQYWSFTYRFDFKI